MTTYADGRTFLTPRDLLEIDPINPARIPTATIQKRLGCSRRRAIALRELATRAPQVLAAHHPARRARA